MNALLLAAVVLVSSNPCEIEEVGAARCVTVRVPENWNQRRSRTIDLNVVVLPATKTSRAKEAVYIFQGGPGQAATTLADFYARTYANAREHRDIVLADQRGTGKSNGLACPYPEGALDLFPLDAIRQCRQALKADLAQYTTDNAVRDAEEIRKALGYERLNLYGTSYGTRMAMRYAQKYPRRVRTLTLKGVVAPGYYMPQSFAAHTERAIELTIADCEADSECRAKYPELRRDYAKLREGLPQGELTHGRVGAVFRTLLQSTGGASDVPRLIHAAASGDWNALETTVRNVRKLAANALFTGMTLSVACSEDAPFLEDPKPDDTLLGGYWIDQFRAACREWSVPPRALDIKRINAPTLIISGYLDSATPPSLAEQAMKHLPRARHIVVRNGAHSFSGMAGCVDRVMSEFVVRGEAAALDASCAGAIRRPPFK